MKSVDMIAMSVDRRRPGLLVGDSEVHYQATVR